MSIFDKFKRKPNGTRQEQSLSSLVEFTDEETDAINRNLDMYSSISKDAEPDQEGELYVHPRVKDGMVAQGLCNYAEELVRRMRFQDHPTDEQATETINKAIKATMKAYKVHPLPIYVFEAARLMEAIGDQNAIVLYRGFLESHQKSKLDQIDIMFLRGHDVDSAVAAAKEKVAAG